MGATVDTAGTAAAADTMIRWLGVVSRRHSNDEAVRTPQQLQQSQQQIQLPQQPQQLQQSQESPQSTQDGWRPAQWLNDIIHMLTSADSNVEETQ